MWFNRFWALLYLGLRFASGAASASAGDCKAAGFDPSAVRCADCAGFETVVGSPALRDQCLGCCVQQVDEGEQRYELAVLEVDARFAAHVPALQTLLAQADDLGVVVRNRIGARPALLMYRERTDDAPEEEVPVGTWSPDTVREYLRTHLMMGVGGATQATAPETSTATAADAAKAKSNKGSKKSAK